MLKPIGPEQAEEAVALLDLGFPERGRDFWQRGLERLLTWPGNAEAAFPPGFLWEEKGAAAGVVLTPASIRQDAQGRRRTLVNVSSWYLHPEHRWKAALMLRALFRDETAIFTDLTPTPEVQKMLPAFGFAAVNAGIELILTVSKALNRTAGATVRPWRAEDRLEPEAPSAPLIALHRKWGCTALVMEHAGGRHLLVLKPFRYRGLQAAKTMYIGSHAALAVGLPALARHLLARGCLVLQVDVRPGAPLAAGFRPRGIWFARGATFDDRTDHIGSELCLLDL